MVLHWTCGNPILAEEGMVLLLYAILVNAPRNLAMSLDHTILSGSRALRQAGAEAFGLHVTRRRQRCHARTHSAEAFCIGLHRRAIPSVLRLELEDLGVRRARVA